MQQLWLGLGHHRKRTYGAERVAHLSSLPLFDAKPQLASSFDTGVLTCGDARTLKFTFIVQRMRNLTITILRLAGHVSIAAALRYHACRSDRPLRTIMNC